MSNSISKTQEKLWIKKAKESSKMEGIIIAALTWQQNNPREIPSFCDEIRFYVCSPNDMIHNYSALQTAWIALSGMRWM